MLDRIDYPVASPNLKGYQQIEGIWLPFIWFSEPQCANFIMQYWFTNCDVYRFEQGYLLRFPYPIGGYCEQFEGWPLTMIDGQLSSMYFSEHEKARIPQGDILLFMGNRIVTFNYQAGEKVDPAIWLKIDDYQLVDVDEWPVEVVELEYIDQTLVAKELDEIFGDKLPKPSKALLKFAKKSHHQSAPKMAKMQAKRSSTQIDLSIIDDCVPIILIILGFIFIGKFLLGSNNTNTPPLNDKPSQTDFLSTFPPGGWILIIIALISLITLCIRRKYIQSIYRTLVHRLVKTKASPAQTSTSSDGVTTPKKYHKRQIWRNYLAKFAILSKLHHLITFRQAKYLHSMMKLFEEGNLNEALRHAIPINSDNTGGQQSFGAPKPRNKLSFSEKIYGEGNSLYLDEQTERQLTQLYRQSFEKLAKAGRIEEAAFVLIELLNNIKEGIDYLEKNNRHQQALEIAIKKDADADLIVRLCCLTGQWDKAIMIAKRHNAFANTIMLLEQQDQSLADKLRLVWANTLAEQAEWLAAIDAIWPLKASRHFAEKWFDYAEKMAEFNADIMIKRLILQPESIHQYQQEIEQLQIDPTRYQNRLAIASAILQHKHAINSLRPLLLSLINAIVSDIAQYSCAFNKVDLFELVDLCQDKALKTDLAIEQLKIQPQQSLLDNQTAQFIEYSALGHRVIYDAVPLRNGHYLLALGEAGIIIVDKMGKQLKHFMIVAHNIVISHNASQILALAQKENNQHHLHKFDLATEKSTSLGYIQFSMCLWEFDGLNWTIITGRYLQVINIEQSLNIVWQIDLGGYSLIDFNACPSNEKWLFTNTDNQYELWNYRLPSHRLIARDELDVGTDRILLSYSDNHTYFRYSKSDQTIILKRQWWHEYRPFPLTISSNQFDGLHVRAFDEFMLFTVPKEDERGMFIHIYHPDSNTIKMTIDWKYATSIGVRTNQHYAIIWDKYGRCTKLDIQKNELVHFTI